jgi:hypothetical protein
VTDFCAREAKMGLPTDGSSPAKPRRKPYRNRLKPAQAEAALKASRGLLEPAARALGVERSSLQSMCKRYARLETVRREQHQIMGDFTESKMFRMIDKEHWPAIAFYLSQQHKDRGYRGTVQFGDTVNNSVTIGSVVVKPSGKFVGVDGQVIKHESVDAPSVHRGSALIDGKSDEPDSQ